MDWLSGLQESIAYMETHLEEEIDLAILASFLHVPPSYYQRIFTLLCQITPMQYLRYRRLSMAAVHLKHSSDTILSTALRFGYESEESFRKAFTRFHGCTPSQARETACAVRSFTPIVLQVKKQGASELSYHLRSLPALTLQVHFSQFDSQQTMFRQEIPMYWQQFFKTSLYQDFCKLADQSTYFKGNILGIDTIAFAQGQTTISYGAAIASNHQLTNCTQIELPSHEWLVFSLKGRMPQRIQQVWTQIYTEFFPHPLYEPLCDIHMEVYTPSNPQQAEIYIPIRKVNCYETNPINLSI